MTRWLFSITLLELFIGGGGRLMEIGPITLRMLLFAACVCAAVLIAWTTHRRDGGLVLALGLVALYLVVHMQPFVAGFIRGASAPDVFADLQASLYMLMAPFFALVLADVKMVERSVLLVKVAAVVMSIVYLLVIMALVGGRLDFLELYTFLDRNGEFVVRGEGLFFYKGFLFLGISILFFTATRGRWHGTLLLLVLAALVLSLTRGFVLSTSIAGVLMLAALGRWRAFWLAIGLAALAAFAVWFYLPSLSTGYTDARTESTSVRFEDIQFMLDRASALTLLLGQGFGSYINGRLAIENSFLWILWKEGLPGLLFWLTPLALCAAYFRRIAAGSDQHRLACGLFFSVVLIYVQTSTNPYLNNPIGLSFVLIALFSLRTLALAERPGKARMRAWIAPWNSPSQPPRGLGTV